MELAKYTNLSRKWFSLLLSMDYSIIFTLLKVTLIICLFPVINLFELEVIFVLTCLSPI